MMTKDREVEISPTALNPLVGIEILDEKNESMDVTEQIYEKWLLYKHVKKSFFYWFFVNIIEILGSTC